MMSLVLQAASGRGRPPRGTVWSAAVRFATTLVVGLGLLAGIPASVRAQTAVQPADQADQPDRNPAFVVRGFGDLQWRATERRNTPNSFVLGQFDIFVTSILNDRISVLAEIVLEASNTTRVVTDLERLQITFRLNDHLQLTGGRYYSGIGFYNTAFHHGAFFEPIIGRPRIFAFEDEGGVLPIHEVGLTMRGSVPKTGEILHYHVEVGNGRQWGLSDAAANPEADLNDAKSTNAGLALRPERWRGLEIGASYFRDTIPETAAVPSVAQRIATSYVAYRTPSTEILAEWLWLYHRAEGGTAYTNASGYLQASRAWGRVRPYYRYDHMGFDRSTPLVGGFGTYTSHTAGLRVDPSEWVGLKTQYERANHSDQRRVNSLRAQLVFVF